MITPPSSRGRMVSVRLSEEEFRLLRKGYPLTGARSLSELARVSMLRAIDQNRDERWQQVPDDLADLNARVTKLEKDLDQLCGLLERRRP